MVTLVLPSLVGWIGRSAVPWLHFAEGLDGMMHAKASPLL